MVYSITLVITEIEIKLLITYYFTSARVVKINAAGKAQWILFWLV